MTVLENLMLGAFRREARRVREESLELVYKIFPVLKERERQRAGTLSGGEQQMLAIGRALMSRPEAPPPRRALARPSAHHGRADT
jgi:branched-chain amino acid transport system ATP-binding protein